MGIVELVVLIVVVAGIVIAFFGWDRYRGVGRQRATAPGSRPARYSSTQQPASGCASGMTPAPGNASTGPSSCGASARVWLSAQTSSSNSGK